MFNIPFLWDINGIDAKIGYFFEGLLKGGFCYHFWTKAMPKIKKYGKKTDASGLSGVEDCQHRKRILKTVEATERFVLCAGIAMGIVQMMALTPSIAETARKHRYLRTASGHKVSEATVLEYLRKNIFGFCI